MERDYGIKKENVILFFDNASSHSSSYSIDNLMSLKVQVIFNVPTSPALNVIELIFADLKFYLRKKNKFTSNELVQEVINFLNQLEESLISKKKSLSLKYYILAIQQIDFWIKILFNHLFSIGGT